MTRHRPRAVVERLQIRKILPKVVEEASEVVSLVAPVRREYNRLCRKEEQFPKDFHAVAFEVERRRRRKEE